MISSLVVMLLVLEPESDQRKTFSFSLAHAELNTQIGSQIEFDLGRQGEGRGGLIRGATREKKEILTS